MRALGTACLRQGLSVCPALGTTGEGLRTLEAVSLEASTTCTGPCVLLPAHRLTHQKWSKYPPLLQEAMHKLYPKSVGRPRDIPGTGPAPVLLRREHWEKVRSQERSSYRFCFQFFGWVKRWRVEGLGSGAAGCLREGGPVQAGQQQGGSASVCMWVWVCGRGEVQLGCLGRGARQGLQRALLTLAGASTGLDWYSW